MHIISASRRTDIPAFHAEWFINRIRDGFVRVRSPFGGGFSEVSLKPDAVIAIVFWTKNPAPLLPHLDWLREMGYCFTFLYTINNYPSFLEPHVPDLGHTLRMVKTISKRFSTPAFRWRYDTVVLTSSLDAEWHFRNFEGLCRTLASDTQECIFSFCDYYKKTVRNMDRYAPDYKRPEEGQCKEIAGQMAEIASRYGISLASCAHDFLVFGSIRKAKCIDRVFLDQVVDSPERKRALGALKTSPTRRECGCTASKDIGAYDTCAHGCVYCYANADPILARSNIARLRPDSLCLDPASAKQEERR